jgi:ketosteroid isomerase-like protein
MAPHPNAIRIREVYAALGAGDVAGVLDGFAADTLFHMPGGGPMAGDHHGRDAVGKVVGQLMEMTGGTMAFHVHGVYADDSHAVVHARETATRVADGATLDVEEVHLLSLDADGRIAEFWDLPADPDLHNGFFDGR